MSQIFDFENVIFVEINIAEPNDSIVNKECERRHYGSFNEIWLRKKCIIYNDEFA